MCVDDGRLLVFPPANHNTLRRTDPAVQRPPSSCTESKDDLVMSSLVWFALKINAASRIKDDTFIGTVKNMNSFCIEQTLLARQELLAPQYSKCRIVPIVPSHLLVTDCTQYG